MEFFRAVFDKPYNWLIFVLMIGAIYGFVSTLSDVKRLTAKMEEEAKKKNRGRKELTAAGGMVTAPSVIDWEDVLGYIEIFNKIKAKYSMWEQFIPIFPLLGLLGTVMGLIEAMHSGFETSDMSLALTSTFAGLVAAIALKVIDALLTGKAIQEKQFYFDTFEMNYHMVVDKKTVAGTDEK